MAKADKLKIAGKPAGLKAAPPAPPPLRAIKGGKTAPAAKPRHRQIGPRQTGTGAARRRAGDRAQSVAGEAVAGHDRLFQEMPGQTRLRAERAAGLRLRQRQAGKFRRAVQRALMLQQVLEQ